MRLTRLPQSNLKELTRVFSCLTMNPPFIYSGCMSNKAGEHQTPLIWLLGQLTVPSRRIVQLSGRGVVSCTHIHTHEWSQSQHHHHHPAPAPPTAPPRRDIMRGNHRGLLCARGVVGMDPVRAVEACHGQSVSSDALKLKTEAGVVVRRY